MRSCIANDDVCQVQTWHLYLNPPLTMVMVMLIVMMLVFGSDKNDNDVDNDNGDTQ